jgi:predicted transcriptional regulator
MKLVDPTDFEILQALSDGKRNTAANLAIELDRDRAYLNSRLPVLADYGLLNQVGPAERSGLYEITERGIAAAKHREAYRRDDVDFEERIEAVLE